ncbi:uncharacterized protein LOC116804496 [Drosophila mojavensis]|uniref:uncharacterized protein LOC116804496 n=1 Tax=Drosophila mojavensis TaxID=7230 RepID=UPI00017CA75A|nr:uncharacterized protein LOC116804496 [Drosophila mojavensis]
MKLYKQQWGRLIDGGDATNSRGKFLRPSDNVKVASGCSSSSSSHQPHGQRLRLRLRLRWRRLRRLRQWQRLYAASVAVSAVRSAGWQRLMDKHVADTCVCPPSSAAGNAVRLLFLSIDGDGRGRSSAAQITDRLTVRTDADSE